MMRLTTISGREQTEQAKRSDGRNACMDPGRSWLQKVAMTVMKAADTDLVRNDLAQRGGRRPNWTDENDGSAAPMPILFFEG
ncbi:MAG: hypothetical protein ACLR4Z_12695 [Butyricicoccaceae bacterium]